MLTTEILLQPQITRILHSSNLFELLESLNLFELRTLRFNHTERQKVRKAQENKDDKPTTSILLQPQKGIYAIAY